MSPSNQTSHEGSCFCGAIGVKATGSPFAMGYCHCDDCRAWSAAPVNAFTLWSRSSVTITRGAENLATYKKTERSHRKYCNVCGGHVLTDHPGDDFVDVYAAILPTLEFAPALHVHCRDSVVSIEDDLPKYVDLPSEFGGSGEMVPT